MASIFDPERQEQYRKNHEEAQSVVSPNYRPEHSGLETLGEAATTSLSTLAGGPLLKGAGRILKTLGPISQGVLGTAVTQDPSAMMGGLPGMITGYSPEAEAGILPTALLKAIRFLAKSPQEESLAISRLTGLAQQSDLSVYSPAALARSALGLPTGQHGFSEAIETMIPPFGTTSISPTDFLDKFIPMTGSKDAETVEKLIESIKKRKLINLPVIAIEPGPTAIQSGRHRMAALREIQGETPVPTNLIDSSKLWEGPVKVDTQNLENIPTSAKGKTISLKPLWRMAGGGPFYGANPMEHTSHMLTPEQKRETEKVYQSVRQMPANAALWPLDILDMLAEGTRGLAGKLTSRQLPPATPIAPKAKKSLNQFLGLDTPAPTEPTLEDPEKTNLLYDFLNPGYAANLPGAALKTVGRGAKAGLEAYGAALRDSDRLMRSRQFADMFPTQQGVIKGKGGNWLGTTEGGNLHGVLSDLKKMGFGEDAPEWPGNAELNKWVESNLQNYVKNLMGTQEDPIRALADQGITHINPEQWAGFEMTARKMRDRGGADIVNVSQTQPGRAWEDVADSSIRPTTAGKIQFENKGSFLTGPGISSAKTIMERDPWIANKDPKTQLYGINQGSFQELGFQHMLDVLQGKVERGELNPQKLNQVSVPDAVRFAHQENLAAAKRAAQASEEAMKSNLAQKPIQEFETGHRWAQLPDAGTSDENLSLINKIGEEAGWCTQDKGTARFYGSSGNNLKVLLGPDGRPHVQIQERKVLKDGLDEPPSDTSTINSKFEELFDQKNGDGALSDILHSGLLTPEESRHFSNNTDDLYDVSNWLATHRPDLVDPSWFDRRWLQVKPMENDWGSSRVKHFESKDPEYVEKTKQMTRDFIKSQNPDYVDSGDLKSLGLRRVKDAFNENEVKKIQEAGIDLPSYASTQEIDAIGKRVWPDTWGPGFSDPLSSMYAAGGFVKKLQAEFAKGGIVSKPVSFAERLSEAYNAA